ncbi:hypothetical protein OPQ81_011052 [Rhizoctonia solani]|nr:hypothetical protein OPQ81_011052 [Rhizoctonia solani]
MPNSTFNPPLQHPPIVIHCTSSTSLLSVVAVFILASGPQREFVHKITFSVLFTPGNQEQQQDQVSDAMHMMYQAPDGIGLNTSRLMVTEQTTIEDLVTYYQQRRLNNYTELLQPAGIATISPLIDAALANVYKINLLNQQCVAVKCVKHTTLHKKLKRAARELSCWMSHEHENILPLLGFAVVKGDLAMVSPWMNNGFITEYVARNPNCDRLGLCFQLAGAIAYLHDNNLVHGDIKGPNVLISERGTVKVMDFGVSIMDHQEIEFSTTSTSGTQRWLAPEILLGQTDSSKEADVYALGMTMIEIYTGEQPYGSTSWFQLTMPVIQDQLRPTRPIRLALDDVGNGVWELMKDCWVADPGERLRCSLVHERLQHFISIRSELHAISH